MATKYYRTPLLVYDCKYHVIFCPKYRRKILVNGLDELVKTVFRKIAEQKGFQIIEMEVMPDHVHLLILSLIHIWRASWRRPTGTGATTNLRRHCRSGSRSWIPSL